MKSKVGFIGLGNMGGPMAANIAKGGYETLVFDVRDEPIKQLEGFGARGARDVGEIIDTCDIIATCVLYDEQVRELFLGPKGIVTKGRAGLVATIHSTVLPDTVRKISDAATARGISIVDAPVSGASERSREGTLTLIVGCDDTAWEKIRPVFDLVGKQLIRVGGPGDAQVAKLGNNIMALCNQLVAMEAIRFVTALGVSKEDLLAVASVSSGASWAASNYAHFDKYGIEHTLAGMRELPHRLGKDLRYTVEVAQSEWTYLPIVALCAQLLPTMFETRWEENKSP
jgi:3-hydroxyisobutyrate dehydrogenase-like beta-hydroxyacid dehydrogenase